MTIRLAPGLVLPDAAVSETFAILAKRGAGKSNAAAVMAEGMHHSGHQFVVVDPVGAWWGLRSSSDGKGPGLPIPILGGYHGDVPLEPTGGEVVADLLVAERLSAVLDVSAFESEGAKRRFLASFAERLFRQKGKPGNDDPMHLFLEEADDYAPQQARGDVARCLGAFQRIVKQGRARGLGATMISQRSAVLNKDLLTQAETLIVLRTTSPTDRKAIEGWVRYHDVDGDVLASLSGLGTGEAWVWSPSFLGLMEKVQIPRRTTFDSASTPKAGVKRKAATLADVDLGALEVQMKETIERAKEQDPRELQRRIKVLEREVASQVPVVERVEVEIEVVPEAFTVAMGNLYAVLDEAAEKTQASLVGLSEAAEKIRVMLEGVGKRAERALPVANRGGVSKRPATDRVPVLLSRSRKEGGVVPSSSGDPVRPTSSEVTLRAGARRMLQTVARHDPLVLTVTQMATLAGMRPTSGTFSTYMSVLKREGLLQVAGKEVHITEAGLRAIGDFPLEGGYAPLAPLSTQEVVELYRGRLRAGARRMLDELVAAYPGAMTKEELGRRVEMEPTSGTFSTYLSTLRRNGLAVVSGNLVCAGEALFLG